MKQQTRQGVFVTNSSSTHVISIYNYIAILTDEEYQKYLKNEVIVTRYGEIYDANDKEVKKLSNWDIVNQHDSWYDDSEVTHGQREIDGKVIHVLSICKGEEYEEFRG
jgi:hypothetical protein